MTNPLLKQDVFLSDLIEANRPIAIYLKNGICLKGVLTKHTKDELFLKDPMKIQIILKRNVSTIETREFA